MATARLPPEQLEKILRELDEALTQAQALRSQIVRAMADHRRNDQQSQAGQPRRKNKVVRKRR
jgi:hypothetical protein